MVWLERSTFGDGPPAIQYFLNSPFNIMLNLLVLSRLIPNAFEFTNSFEDRECMHYSLFYSFLPIGSFERRQITGCRFSEEFCANPRNISTNKKRGIALCCLQNSFVNSKLLVIIY